MEKERMNTCSVLGFILSFFCSIPGIIFSIIGLKQITKYGDSGKIFSLFGIIIGFIRIFVIILLTTLFCVYLYNIRAEWFDPSIINGMSEKEKCLSYSTYCYGSKWECSRNGCYCEYDNGVFDEELFCHSHYFD